MNPIKQRFTKAQKIFRAFSGALTLSVLCLCCTNSSVKRETVKESVADTSLLKLEKVAGELRSPVAAVFPDDNRMLVGEQTGVIQVIEKGELSILPFLDIRSKLVKLSGRYDERGLLGMALHPQFKSNKKFYVYYSAPSDKSGSDHKSVISEFRASANPDQADLKSERIILTIEQPESNHNGGDMHFGPDGFLYITLGDGGGSGDEHGTIGNGQNLTTLLGKILRIDINKGEMYSIPADNPFVGKNAKPEIWAYGLRNAWRFSFDRKTGQLFAADVGQNSYEEVNIIEKGANYGWRIMEGNHCFNPQTNCKRDSLKLPINEYDHSTGVSITGGYVYNGKSLPNLVGKYIFADWTGPLFFLQKARNSWTRNTISLSNKPSRDLRILSFAEDNTGELYILTNQEIGSKNTTGAVYKLIKPD